MATYCVTIYRVPARLAPIRFDKMSTGITKKSSQIDVIRSPHIDKKSREQFELVRHKYIYKTKNISVFLVLMNYIKQQRGLLRIKISCKEQYYFTSTF